MSSKPQSDSSKDSPNSSPNSSPSNSKGDSKGDTKGGKEAAQRQALPFEPTKSRKQAEKPSKSSPAPKAVKAEVAPRSAAKPAGKSAAPAKQSTAQAAAIPDAVSQRMIKRMAVLCGLPSVLGMSTFVVSYLLRVNDLFEVPTYAVLLVSLGWFGLGVLGLSYGVLSASWDEEVPGSRVGWSEFRTNWGRMTSAWRSSKESAKEKS